MGYALHQFGYGFPQTFFWKGVDTPNAKKFADLVARYSRSEQLREAMERLRQRLSDMCQQPLHSIRKAMRSFPLR